MEYEDFYRENIKETIVNEVCDIFISAYNRSDRISYVYNKVTAGDKKYLLFDEYDFDNINHPYERISNNNDLIKFFSALYTNKTILIDITGFIRPYLINLINILREIKFKEVGFIYSEPNKYIQAEDTDFSMGELDVKPIDGFANESGSINDKNKILIIGAGFDLDLFNACVDKYKIIQNKKLLIGFPSLRPDMYQQNLLQIHELKNYTAQNFIYAPASNPFITAKTINNTVEEFKKAQSVQEVGVYLAPLSTKAQVLGFALYAIKNSNSEDEITIFFPHSTKYSQETSEGIARIWKYKIDFSAL